jgi:copper(I)-binding protein
MNNTWIRVFALLMAAGSTAVPAHEFKSGTLTIQHPWSRPTAEGSPVGVAYFVIVNHGQKPDTLVAASTPAAESVEFHRTIIEGGMARMRPAGEIVIAPGATVKAEPEGLHLMLVGLKQPLVEGSMVPLVLRFSGVGEVTVQLEVEPRAAVADPHAGH